MTKGVTEMPSCFSSSRTPCFGGRKLRDPRSKATGGRGSAESLCRSVKKKDIIAKKRDWQTKDYQTFDSRWCVAAHRSHHVLFVLTINTHSSVMVPMPKPNKTSNEIRKHICHYDYVIMTTLANQITSLAIVYSIVYLDADQRKHQSSASLAFVWGIHRDRWIPRTKGQLRGKCFHLMTSSCGKGHKWRIYLHQLS